MSCKRSWRKPSDPLTTASVLDDLEIGIGTWQWGDQWMWGYGGNYAAADVRAAFDACLAGGHNFFDTAEIYGQGRSERLLGQFARAAGQPVVIATKFFPFPWRLGQGRLRSALRHSLDRLGVERVDLYQIHFPLPPVTIETWMAALADAVEAGLVGEVGVSNYNPAQLRRAYAALSQRGVKLASNQVQYSLLNRAPERTGLAALCRELDVRLIAYSPLAQGILSGKYQPNQPPPGVRGRRYNRAYLARVQPLLALLRERGEAHGGKTPGQVALNWLIGKGALPIPGVKNARQAEENLGAAGWQLTEAEILALDAASDPL
jgi:aryl-alcohol dehydrogenase-like predicted oxidoreductase